MGASQFHTFVIIRNGAGQITTLPVKPSQRVRQTTNDPYTFPLLRLSHPLVEDAECLGIAPKTPACRAQDRETGKFKAPILESTGKGDTLLKQVERVLKMPLPVGLHPQGTEEGSDGIGVSLPLANLERHAMVPIRFVQVPPHLMHASQGIETHRKDFLIPRLLGELYRLLRTSFLQETVLVSRFQVVHIRQMKETFTLLTLMP